MSRYLKREVLSNLIDNMLSTARKSKQRVTTECLLPSNKWYYENAYWLNYINRVDRSIDHYCDTCGICIDPDYYDGKYTIKQLEVIKFILSLRRNNGYKKI